MLVRTIEDLRVLRRQRDLESVSIDAARFKYNGLLHYACRYAFFACAVGGTITLADPAPAASQAIGPFLMGWPTVRAIAINALCPECERLSDPSLDRMVFVRRAPPPPPGWSAGVIFSGRDQEMAQLSHCLAGLAAQPELQSKTGEILVCGPQSAADALAAFPYARYVPFEHAVAGAFPISLKKNHLLGAMRFPRRLVLHARITLDQGAIARAPEDFDILSPNIFTEKNGVREPNIGFTCIDTRWPHLVPHHFERSTTSLDPERYLTMLAGGAPFVDGGAFAVTARVLDSCRLNDHLYWGECEDVEWCLRARAMGFLVDMEPDFTAANAVSKVTSLAGLPMPVARGVRSLNRVRQGAMRLGQRLRMLGAKTTGTVA